MEQRNEDLARFIARREEGEAINLKAFVYKLIGYRHWFLPAMIICTGVAQVYNWYTPPTYAVTGTLFVEEKNEENISLNNLFDNFQFQRDVKIPNHLGILASFNLNRQVIENLGWNEGDGDELALDYMKRLEVTRLDKNMDLISIWLKSRNPQKDVEYLNELENTYVAYGLKQKKDASLNAIRFIDGQLAAVADTLGRNNELYAYLLEKRSEAEIANASVEPDVEIIDRARDSTVVEVGPRKMMNLLMGLFFGFAIPFLMVILKEFFKETIQRAEELEKLTPLPVIGNISHSPFPEKMAVLQHPRSPIAETFRELRTNLETIYQERNVLVVGVHSMMAGEGKSFVALNLACIFAMNKKKVVLIGADLRKPDLHQWLNLDNQHGLGSYLAGDDTLEEVIRPTEVPNLHLITSGPALSNPADFLNTKEFGFLVNGLKSRYDMIIIDNAPSGIVTEGAIVRRHTDFDLFVIRQHFSTKKWIDVLNKITIRDMKKSGVVFNDIPEEEHVRRLSAKRRRQVDPYFTDTPLIDSRSK